MLFLTFSLIFFFFLIKRTGPINQDVFEKYKLNQIYYDTFIDSYRFISNNIHHKDGNKSYNKILIMGLEPNLDTIGFFREDRNKIYFLDKNYQYLRKESVEETHYVYPDMNEQIFFDFSTPIDSSIFFITQKPFIGMNTIRLISKKYEKKYSDTIYYCERIDSLSTTYSSEGLMALRRIKIGKKVGLVELMFEDSNNPNKFSIYIPQRNVTWKIF